jgi:asparagine synthase (glutamine-hydrolysing)
MCGIAGILDLDGVARPTRGLTAEVRAMAATQVHRGPDDGGVWADEAGGIALAHNRLSIVDLSELGRNPMSWDGGRLWITFNGEVYNFRELRRELEALGHRFRSQTDTEVVLAAYDTWGIDCLSRFAGMFAFGLWDAARRRLWLVRDRLGKKPLYYADYRGRLRFGSELKAIVSDPQFPSEISPAALRLFLRYGYVPAPLTIFSAARKLPPAHYLICERGRVTIQRYWDPIEYAGHPVSCSAGEAEDELERLLSTAVRQRALADVPLGAFLSGGIDSSLVVALLQEQSARPVQTFSIRFENPEYNEADHAAAVARHVGTDHYEETCSESQLFAALDRLTDMFDEPFADSSAVPTHLVSAIARRRVTVALSGDGGDELFLGYPRYGYYSTGAWALSLPRPIRRAAASVANGLPTRRLRRIADVLSNNDPDVYSRFVTTWSLAEIADLTGAPPEEAPLYADALARTTGVPGEVRPSLIDLVSYLPDDILTKVDRTSMAVSLEVRAPLLDHRVVEFALRLPVSLKRTATETKWLLRRLLYKRIPRELVDRPKMGFGVPLGDWFRGPLKARMDECCSGGSLEDLGIRPGPICRVWSDFLAGRHQRTDRLWQIYTLAVWARKFRAAAAPLAAR